MKGRRPADAALSWRPCAGALSVSALQYCPIVGSLACGLCTRWVGASTLPHWIRKFSAGPLRPLDGGCTDVRSTWKLTPRCPRAWLSEPRAIVAQSVLISSAPLAPSPSSRTAFLGRPGCVLQRGYIVYVLQEARASKNRYHSTCRIILAFRQSFRGFWRHASGPTFHSLEIGCGTPCRLCSHATVSCIRGVGQAFSVCTAPILEARIKRTSDS